MDTKGHHSNPKKSSPTTVSGGSRSVPEPGSKASGASVEAWLELKGQLSNPESELNRSVRELTEPFDRSRTPLDVAKAPRAKPHRRPRRLSEGELEKMAEEYRAGDTVPMLVERYGVHRTTILGHLERMGVPRRANKRKLTDAQVKEVRRLYRLGLSYAELGRKFGVSGDVVKKELLS